MSLDFCCLCLLFPAIVKDDLSKRGIENKQILGLITLFPLLGTLIYTCFRPSVDHQQSDSVTLANEMS